MSDALSRIKTKMHIRGNCMDAQSRVATKLHIMAIQGRRNSIERNIKWRHR